MEGSEENHGSKLREINKWSVRGLEEYELRNGMKVRRDFNEQVRERMRRDV
jgi:hypothetical protein